MGRTTLGAAPCLLTTGAGGSHPVSFCCVRGIGLLLVALAGVPIPTWAQTASPAAAGAAAKASPPPAGPAATPIPVPEIAQRAEEVAIVLRQSQDALAADPEVQRVVDRLPAAGEWIRGRLTATRETLVSWPSSTALVNASDSWRLMRSELT